MESLTSLFDREAADEDFELLPALDAESFWDRRLAQAIAILEEPAPSPYAPSAVIVVYWASSRVENWPCPKMKVVALLYDYLIATDAGADENLVWSIATTLKGVSYESDWDPMKDSEVTQYMQSMKGER